MEVISPPASRDDNGMQNIKAVPITANSLLGRSVRGHVSSELPLTWLRCTSSSDRLALWLALVATSSQPT